MQRATSNTDKVHVYFNIIVVPREEKVYNIEEGFKKIFALRFP